MPKVTADSKSPKPYGIDGGSNNLLFRERLMKRFAAHEWVRVINIDNEPYFWQYLPQFAEEFEFTPDPMKITRRGEVEQYYLDPGESEVIPGENAYVMIEGLYKRLVSKKVVFSNPNIKEGMARSFNWTDPIQQEDYIDRIFLGKENPEFNGQQKEDINDQIPETPVVGRPKPGPKPKNVPTAARLRKAL